MALRPLESIFVVAPVAPSFFWIALAVVAPSVASKMTFINFKILDLLIATLFVKTWQKLHSYQG